MTMKQAASSAPSLRDCMRRDHHPLPNLCRCRNGSRRLRQWRTDRAEFCGLLRGPRRSCCASRETWPSCMGNVLDFGPRGWRAIDPKGLIGESGFDFANTFCNPDFALATSPGRLARQATVIAETAGRDRKRLLQWTLCYAGLSAAWIIGDGDDAALPFAIAEAAGKELAS